MNPKSKQRRCVECRYCDLEIPAEGAARRVCAHAKRPLPANVTSRLACGKFKFPRPAGHWGG